MRFISLGKIDKTLIVILIGCVICFLNRFLNQVNCQLHKTPVLNNICISISRFITVIPFIIYKLRNKRLFVTNNQIEKTNTNDIKYIYNDMEKQKVKGKWRLIILTGMLHIIEQTCFVYSFKIKTNCWITFILFASIFYYLIFKVKLYKHHYLSILIIISIGLTIDLVVENLQNEITSSPFNLLAKYMKEILFSLFNVLAKYIMEKKFVTVYEFSFYDGFINLVAFVVFAILDYKYINLNDYDKFFDNFNNTELLVIFGVIFTQLGINLTTLFTTKNNTPCHLFIIFVFGNMAYYVNFKGYAPLIIACLIIILFLSLIFNEIIEVNVFGLSYNTKKNIMERASSELLEKTDSYDEEV